MIPSTSKIQNLTISSYNILADLYVDPTFFDYCDKKYLDFQHRQNLIVDKIKSLSSDIVCIQEADHFKEFYQEKFENLGYDCLFHPKGMREEGLLMLTMRGKIKVKSYQVFQFDLLIPGKLNQKHYQKNNSYQLVEVCHLHSGFTFLVINTHLFWNPNQEEIKYLQSALILEGISKVCLPTDNIFLCGDFNSLPDSNVYNLITDSLEPELSNIDKQFQQQVRINDIKYIFKKYKSSLFKLKSVLKNYEDTQDHPEFTNYTLKGVIDYIFYNPSMKDFTLEKVLSLPIEDVKKQIGLPNLSFPSDHLPITAIFQERKQQKI